MIYSASSPYKDSKGTRRWYVDGKLHRADGPAVEWANGDKEWWVNDKVHRIDGPAVEYADGHQLWYVNGKEISLPYTYVLTAAFRRGIPIPREALSDMLEGMAEAKGAAGQNDLLGILLHKYWPVNKHEILVSLFMDPDPTIKHLAFSLLGRGAMPKATSE